MTFQANCLPDADNLHEMSNPVFWKKKERKKQFPSVHTTSKQRLFVCVEVLRPSQPSVVMSSAISLPNHTFTGQA